MNSSNFTTFTGLDGIGNHARISTEFKILKMALYSIIFLLSMTGNILVISVICFTKKMRSSSHILILHVAICDLLTPSLSIPFDLAYEELKYKWIFGKAMCKILWPCQTYLTTSTTFLLTAICVDRYRALVYPFSQRWKGRRLYCKIASIFAFAAMVVIPYMLVLNLSATSGIKDCVEEWPEPAFAYKQAYTMVLFLLQYAVPLVVMIVLYSIALQSLSNANKTAVKYSSLSKKNSQRSNSVRSDTDHQNLEETRREQHFKVTKMFIIVVIVFAISMFPNQVLWLWVDYGDFSNHPHFPVTAVVCRLFTYSNSVLNPFIYGLYSKEFRSGYIRAGKTLSSSRDRYKPSSRDRYQAAKKMRGGLEKELGKNTLLNGAPNDGAGTELINFSKLKNVDKGEMVDATSSSRGRDEKGRVMSVISVPPNNHQSITCEEDKQGNGLHIDDSFQTDEISLDMTDDKNLMHRLGKLQESRC